MQVSRLIVAGILLSSPVVAFADPLPAPTPVAATGTGKDPNQLICKPIEQLGSRIQAHRTCATAAQWKEYEYRAGQWTERMSSMRPLYGGG